MEQKSRLSQELQQKARALLRQQRVREALAAAGDACRQDPGSADAWFTLASVYLQLQDFDGIAECCRNVIKRQPDNAAAHFNLGLALQSSDSHQEAIEAYREATRLQENWVYAE